ncbi:hypothetical protein VTJ83DRAFT_1742 [Remersonia thermophila]|uniref:WD-like domain-containing protein n=1 Tax=Remersonia thermophila TaxID=72144 RepID=A0ABR4DGS4_9PEZI
MHFATTTALLTAALAASVHAAPSAPVLDDPNLIILHTFELEHGTAYELGLKNSTAAAAAATTEPEASRLRRRCGSNQVQCRNDNKSTYVACDELIKDLDKDRHRLFDPSAIGWYHIDSWGTICYVTWPRTVPGLKQGHVVSAARKTLGTCNGGARVSGIARDVNLNGVCTFQCLSSSSVCRS